MATATTAHPASIGQAGLTIAGVSEPGEGPDLQVFNPATEELIATVGTADARQTERAIAAARTAFDDGPWSRFSPQERSLTLHRLADVLERHADELVASVVAEVGTPVTLTEQLQVETPIRHLRHYAESATALGDVSLGSHFDPVPSASMVAYRPAGVVAAITAYNYPLLLAISKLGASLAAGCTAVLLPSGRTPLTTLLLGGLLEESGLPAGTVNVLAGEADVARQLTESRLIDKVTFTGSTTVGRHVMRQAATGLAGVMLELGGKSPLIVLPGTDLADIVLSIHMRYSRNAGQGCMSPTRLFVHQGQWDEFLERSKAAFAHITVGDPWDRSTDVGPLIRPEHRARVEQFVTDACQQGARIAAGGGRPETGRGWYTNPTLVVGVENSWPIAREEIFGPIAVAMPYSNVEEAVGLANDSEYGLAAYVYGDDTEAALAVAARLRAGTVTVNGGGGLRPDATIGGFKQSGIGREQGRWGISEFLEPQHIQWALR
jgi:aldehyde dehydrogenase (NAD+)